MATRSEPRLPLSRDRILSAALELVDEQGLDALTMRGLGQRLGFEAMSLYNYVAGKDDVIDGILDLVLAQSEPPAVEGDWASAIRESAVSVHDALRRHPWAVAVLTASTRIQPARLHYMDSLLGRLREAGFSAETTYTAYHVLDAHIFGFSLWEAAHTFTEVDPAEVQQTVERVFESGDYPHLAEHARQHFEEGPHREVSAFELGLDLIIEGLRALNTGGGIERLRMMREHFLLDPDVVYLNHGSFGACPRSVFERYRYWQRELEREPVQFMNQLPDLLVLARADLGGYVGAPADDLTFVANATTGVNIAARALELQPGDEVLATDLEYGACDLTWEHVCERVGARYVRTDVEQLFDHVTERTRAVFVSHITSETALLLPVEQIVARARAEGLATIVDGAHAVGQLDLDLVRLGADFYAGNCHKWLCAPKGAGFLYVRPEWQERAHAPIVSWGYDEPATFISRTERQGTRDPAAYLAVGKAITFLREHEQRREHCVALCREARGELCELLGTEPLAPEEQILQMASVRLPRPDPELSQRLYDEHRIEIPTMGPRDDLLRISIALYTEREDVDRLLEALRAPR